ncbi:JAB domain-containing protein [Paraflavitalea soli]|uniref:JAB domain-containing protein n=1 Tax=Paraflavitalea soli TaxID=2315862 RepID=A0A3B7MXQ4_9BACT|nr:DNA repair protein RadC [Paraflavitalea soli]AXY77850.1 JAB domain-containing protein [Paraflavitalea soli]
MQAKNYPIKDWAEDDRPREKLLSKSPNTLSNSELLAILIQYGIKGKSAVDLAQDIMRFSKNDLNNLFKVTVKELMSVKGVGMTKAVSIVAALELGRRRHALESFAGSVVTNSRDVAQYLRTLLRDRPSEVFAVMYLSQSNRITHFHIVSEGGITGTIADPRLIIKQALEENAVNLILCHNHPSGNLQPSAADQLLTQKIKQSALLFDIKVLDHIIVSEEGYYSFADEGTL